ncbi:hypothetical protein COY05_01530, partial [Candidatus Peregrinibacteria bacterium CG_4_10_14_0_2_um_filter_38_24]
MKYFLYVRKSTDEEDRQVLSIEAQLAELHEFARKENLVIAKEFIESKTAKAPRRPLFNEMISLMETSNEKIGILAWHPDRLARNSIDGGKIIYLVDTGKIESLKFLTFWFENTPQGKFMLNIAFGQSKYYIDNLSENVKRGIRQKLRRGEWPALAPPGYLNDLKTHTIIKDPNRAELIKKLFWAYAEGKYSFKYLQKLSLSFGLVSRYENKSLAVSKIQKMLKNPFYYGVFIHRGEMYQGSHEPIISKQLFDKVQEIMKQRGKPRKAKVKLAFAFRGTFNCGECGRSITAEKKTKKSGRTYTYYRCTKKNVVCNQKYLEEQPLIDQLNNLFQKVALNNDLKNKFLREWEKDYKKAQTEKPSAQNLKLELKNLEEKQMRLLDMYLEQTISEEEYTKAKEKIINSKIDLKEKINDFGRKGNNWLEPFKEWILSAHQAVRYANTENL